MCGIVGKINFDGKPVSPEEIRNLATLLSHRGPDDTGVYADKNIGLGHKRLSIIDLSPLGHQPMSDESKNIWIVFNGEIYNFLEQRALLEERGVKFKSKTDTEVIIYLYKKYGTGCLKHLRGMFAFAIWDNSKKQLFIARDRLGKKPLKYYCDKNTFIFASELKAILSAAEVKKEIDFSAIDEYLTYQYVPHPKTGFKNIQKLEPAHYLIIKENGVIIKECYWRLDFSHKLQLSEAEWKQEIVKTLKESVKMRLISDVPLGAHLSGGIDSSLIVALMSEQISGPVKTFSIGFKEARYNELPYAKLVADRYKTEHHEFVVEPNAMEVLPQLAYQYEEPYADSSALPTWYLSEMTRKYVTVALNGDGGDENFAGYTRYNAVKIFNQLRFVPFKNALKKINSYLYKKTNRRLFSRGYRLLDAYNRSIYDFYLKIINYFSQEEKVGIYGKELVEKIGISRWHSFVGDEFEKSRKFDWLDQILSADINTYLPDDLLVKVDIASMAHSLEIRTPFLDHEFMDLCAQMPSKFKIRGHNKKHILKEIAYNYLPKKCIDRPKQGFGVPLEFWFKGQLEDYVKDKLLNKNFTKYGFKREGLEKIIASHKKGGQNFANHIWALLMLEGWFSTWFN
jgi:asparagine synthase (glutamine-hydrolysing)